MMWRLCQKNTLDRIKQPGKGEGEMSNLYTSKECKTCAYWSGNREVKGANVTSDWREKGICAYHQSETKQNDKCSDHVRLNDSRKAEHNLKNKKRSGGASNKRTSSSGCRGLIGIVVIIIIIAAVVAVKNGGSKSTEVTAEDRIEALENAVGSNAEIGDDVPEFITSNMNLFDENVKEKKAKKKVEDTITISEYCANAENYDGRFICIKNAEVNSVSSARKMKKVEIIYNETDFIQHTLYIFFYNDVDVDSGDEINVFAYPICQNLLFVDDSISDHIDNGIYEEYLLGSIVVKKEN